MEQVLEAGFVIALGEQGLREGPAVGGAGIGVKGGLQRTDVADLRALGLEVEQRANRAALLAGLAVIFEAVKKLGGLLGAAEVD